MEAVGNLFKATIFEPQGLVRANGVRWEEGLFKRGFYFWRQWNVLSISLGTFQLSLWPFPLASNQRGEGDIIVI